MKSPREVSHAEWKSCLRKQAFPTREAAQQVIQRSNHQEGVKLDCYRCRFGRHWHLTEKRDKK